MADQKVLEAYPDSYQALNNMGSILERQGRLEEAQHWYARGQQSAPDNQALVDNLARVSQKIEARALEQIGETAAAPAGDGEERLSLCMIAGNEEARLGHCLESVQGLVDEIVVVDTGSTDRTVEIAERFGARIGHFPWCDDWSAARNVSLSLATGDWIMWLDPDDLLPREYHARIRDLIRQGRDKSYFFVLDDQGFENVSCLQMRLFPNLPGVAFELPVHEQVTPSLGRLNVKMVSTDIRVVHTGYPTPEVVRAKKDRYLRIMEKWIENHPEDYIVRSHVALTYHSTGRLDEW